MKSRLSTLAPAMLLVMVFHGVCRTAHSQAAPSTDQKLNLRAALVLAPDFCATKMKKNKENFEVGKVACEVFGTAFEQGFSSLTTVAAAASSANAQVVLLPRFVDLSATKTMGAFSNRELTVLLEWTVKDKSGRTVWIETVQGSGKNHIGNAFTYKTDLKEIIHYAVKDLAHKSVAEMDASPQLRKLAQQAVAKP